MKTTSQHLIAEVPHRQSRVEMTIGIDLGDVWSHYCILNQDGEVVDRGRFRTTPKAVEKWFTDLPPVRVAMEAGTRCDLLNFEEAGPAVEGIPGAVRIAPARLRIRDNVFMPKDVEVVLYLFFTSGIYKRSRGTRSSASRYRERIRTRRWAQCLEGRGVSRYNGSQLIY
jgi:hypothetical protein